MKTFFRLTKVDEAKREVWGRATEEVVDRSGEIFDYATSKPYFEKWSAGFAEVTDGKSLGNIRSMHGNVAAGKIIQIDFQDAEKAIDIGTKIVDDNEWQKVLEGVHTGFSIGGSYVGKKWKDEATGAKRYTADPVEISLVDSPCLQTAKFFDVIKADGSVIQKAFVEHPESEPLTIAALRKSMWSIADFAGLLQSLAFVAWDSAYEAECEGDASPIPAALGAWIEQGLGILQAMTAEECAELMSQLPSPEPQALLAMAAKVAGVDLEKAGKKFSKATAEALGKVHGMIGDCHKAMADLGFDKPGNVEDKEEEADKAAAAEAIQKAAGLETDLAKAQDDLTKAQARITELEARPEAAKAVAVVFDADKQAEMFQKQQNDKAEDLKKVQETTDPEARYLASLKFTHKYGHKPE